MRASKLQTFETMRTEYQTLKASWGGYGGYDWWFAQPVNNAQIASVAIYTQLVPGFQAMLAREAGDLPRFYAAVRELTKLTKAQRRASLGVVEQGTEAAGG
jgi:predicted aminopeptidase